MNFHENRYGWWCHAIIGTALSSKWSWLVAEWCTLQAPARKTSLRDLQSQCDTKRRPQLSCRPKGSMMGRPHFVTYQAAWWAATVGSGFEAFIKMLKCKNSHVLPTLATNWWCSKDKGLLLTHIHNADLIHFWFWFGHWQIREMWSYCQPVRWSSRTRHSAFDQLLIWPGSRVSVLKKYKHKNVTFKTFSLTEIWQTEKWNNVTQYTVWLCNLLFVKGTCFFLSTNIVSVYSVPNIVTMLYICTYFIVK